MTRTSMGRCLLGACLAALTPIAASQIAQEPLLNRLNSVAPNLVLIFDTSGSMDMDSIYEYGNPSDTGPVGPGTDGTTIRGPRSPDVNKLYYDPRVRYRPRVAYDGTPLPLNPLSDRWKVYFRIGSGSYTTGGALTLATSYHRPDYNPPSWSVVPGSSASYPIDVDISELPVTRLFPKFVNRTDCVTYSNACTFTEERRNHSNWKKWYSTRALMAQTGLGAALQPVTPDSIRLGFGSLTKLEDEQLLSAGVSSFSAGPGGGKQRFFNWLYSQSFSGGTPNLPAVNNVGRYYQRTDSDGPWATTPNPSSVRVTTEPAPSGPGAAEPPANHASCRRSTTLLVTDGYWNSGRPTTAGNSDNTPFTISPAVGPPFSYSPVAPYADNYSNTLADLAMHYWGRDLRTDLPNRVAPLNTIAGQNPSTWQNTSFYAVTLGLLGTLPRTASVTADLASGAISWPEPVANGPTTIDDTWHATINGRGELLNANNSQELTDAITRVITGIAGTPQTQSGVAVSATFLRNGTRKYKPEYVPGSWTGRLSAVELDVVTGNDKVPPVVHWQVERGLDPTGEPLTTIPAHTARNVGTWNGAQGVVFNATNTGLTASLVNYIRGDTSMELRKTGGIFRNRLSRLGDIVNSSPVFVRDNLDLQYESLGLGDYRDFVAMKATRSGILFIGANDGMLHAFSDADGAELFAYVPQAVVPELHKLTQTPFVHRYYVDGPNVETDAYRSSDDSWRNLLLGTTGAGAKAVYALDVTYAGFGSMLPADILWEVSDTKPGFGRLGHVLSEVQTGVTVNGRWIAVFGNGFGSAGGGASIFIVDLFTGELLNELRTSATGSNGMGGVRLVFDGRRRVLGGYAGDLQGNLWKFDLTGDPVDWKIGLNGSPLYSAGATRPITAPPTVVPHPDRGFMIAFGTGKFFETSDASPPYNPQRLVGIWDAQPFGAPSTPAGAASLTGVSQLVQRTISTVTVGASEYFTVSSGPITWGNGLIELRGWYLDLPNSGQRTVNPLELLGGTFLLASTLSPESSVPPDVCVMSGSGSGWAYIIDAVTGSGPTLATLDTNLDGVVNDADEVVGGYRDAVDGRPAPISLQVTARTNRLCVVTAQSTCTQIRLQCGQQGMPACPSSSAGSIKSRSWRQLFMR